MLDNTTRAKLKAFESVWKDGEWTIAHRMMLEIDLLFRQHGINYFVCYGTFLGAVRCQGVIPWDDDIDYAILEPDEHNLQSLEPGLNELGYSICNWSIPWRHGKLDYYKIWISNIKSRRNLIYSWPFIDIFVFRAGDTDGDYFDGHHHLKGSNLFPLKSYKFGPLVLPGPTNSQFLKDEYGDNYLTSCASSPNDHKEERPKAVQYFPLKFLAEHGYCTDVHRSEKLQLDSVPVKLSGDIHSTSGHVSRIYNQQKICFHLSESSSTIWNLIDNSRTIGSIIDFLSDHYHQPRITFTVDVIDTIKIFYQNDLVRL